MIAFYEKESFERWKVLFYSNTSSSKILIQMKSYNIIIVRNFKLTFSAMLLYHK